MKKGQEYIGTVTDYVFPNKGIIYYKEKQQGEQEPVTYKVVVKDSFPGQELRFQLTKKRSGKCEGKIVEVLKKSELEDAAPACPNFGICGGCSLQTMSYEHQLELKKNVVKSILDGVITEPYEFEGIISSPKEWEYRNKMEFSFGDECKGGALALGMHKKGSFYDIVTTDSCKIVHEDYNQVLRYVLDYFAERNIPFYHKMAKEGFLRHLLLRRAVKTGEMTISLVTTSAFDMDLSEFVQGLLGLKLEGTIVGILHIVNDGLADVVRSDRTEVLYGSEYFLEEILGLKFKISTFSFFQTNSLGAERLYEKAREYVGDTRDKLVFDLYSGTGTIAQMLSAVAKKVIGVEIVEEAVEAAKENAKLNGIANCEFIAGDVLKVIDGIEERPDLIVLDPPRDGIHPKALEKIIQYGVEHMVYISCKPTSLARDLVVLQEGGYQVKRACCVDMFPGTGHVETVVKLVRKNPDTYIDITVDMDELDLTCAESKATYREIKDYIFEKHGVKVSSLYIAQVKEKHGIIERENYNKARSEDSRQPKCPVEKERLIEEALRYFKMIS